MKAVIYARVSTEDQSTDNQLPALVELANRRGWEVAEIYTEEASAWRAGHQKKLQTVLNSASRHEFQYLLVWSLDRLTRQGIGYVMQLFATFTRYGVTVVSVQEAWTEQSGPFADLLLAITGWVAEFESKRRSERIKAALVAKVARGEKIGRKPGSKDAKPRKRTGYLLRYADRR